jgi:hypothetical protein
VQKAERSNGHRAFERRFVHRVTAAGIDDRAAIHHREMVPQLAREVEILLDQHHRDLPKIAQIGDGAADVLDDRGLATTRLASFTSSRYPLAPRTNFACPLEITILFFI